MIEEDILNLIANDKWMMKVLRIAEELNLPDWAIGAGFVRSKVWDYLHGISREEAEAADIDLAYFDPNGNDEKADEEFSRQMREKTGMNWEIINQAYTHKWKNLPPYLSTVDAMSRWVETATTVGVTLKEGELKLIAPHGIDDLVNLIIRPVPNWTQPEILRERVESKQWLKKWPKLRVEE